MSGATGSTGPYGELITTTLRVLTWNAWGRFGPWEARETRADPDPRGAPA